MKSTELLLKSSLLSLILTSNMALAQEIDFKKPSEPKKLEAPRKFSMETLSFQKNEEDIKKLVEKQKQKDLEDLESLWNAAIEKNVVIKFAIDKLSIPPEQRRAHSSLMARSVSSLISGASMLPGIFGADSYASCATNVSGKMVSRYINQKGMPKDVNLTDTELIQLASMIQGLQNDLIKNYYEYKGSLNALSECREKLMLYHKNYSRALDNNELMSAVVESAMYDKQKMQEYKLKQDVKVNLLALERLAGKDTVANLNLTRYALDEPIGKTSSQLKQSTNKSSTTLISNKKGGDN